MPKLDLLSIQDLAAQGELEPELRQLIVEGNQDIAFNHWLFPTTMSDPSQVMEISRIDVPASVVEKHGQSHDNHGRLLALGLELAELNTSLGARIQCVADGEYDYLFGKVAAAPTITYIDATSPESLALDEEAFRKFRLLALRGSADSYEAILNRIDSILRFLFAARAANLSLRWGCVWPKPKFRVDKNGCVEIDREKFLNDYASSSPELRSVPVLAERTSDLLKTAEKLPLCKAVRGHDIGEVLGIAVRDDLESGTKDMFKAPICEKIIKLCLDRSSILKREPYEKLQKFLSI